MDTYKQIDLTEYVQTGEGGNGKTYVTSADSDEILKVNNARLSTWEVVKHTASGMPLPRNTPDKTTTLPSMPRPDASPPSTSFSATSSRSQTLSRRFSSASMYIN